MLTITQKNDRLKQNRTRRLPQKIRHCKGDNFIIEVDMGLRKLIVPVEQRLSSGEIEAISRWEDDGGRTHRR